MQPIQFNQSILVSNIFDPISKKSNDLNNLYQQLGQAGRYKSVETRVSRDLDHIDIFNRLIKDNNWQVTTWATGDITRANLNPSSTNEALRIKTVELMKEMIDLSITNQATYFGIASGPLSDDSNLEASLNQLEKTVRELFTHIGNRNLNIIIEPLDAFSHKKNILGTSDTVLEFLKRFDSEHFIKSGRLSICWDSAHFALNKEDFRTSIHKLAPYISRIHFANAILDVNHPEYGDWHMKFIEPGFISQEIGNEILKALVDAPDHQSSVLVACEIRSTKADDLWQIENESYHFVKSAIEHVNR